MRPSMRCSVKSNKRSLLLLPPIEIGTMNAPLPGLAAFDPSKLGGATLTTSFKKAYPLTANPPGQTAGAVKGKLTVAATATLARL